MNSFIEEFPVCRYNSFMDWYDHRNMVYLDLWCNGIMVDLEQPLAAILLQNHLSLIERYFFSGTAVRRRD